MKILKNIYVFMIVACSVLTFWVVSTKQTEQSDFLLRNVEALATGELNPDCDNRNGYRKWNAKPIDSNDVEETFYDCCYVLRYGYRPNTDCKY